MSFVYQFPIGTNIVYEVAKSILDDFKGENFSKALVIFPHKRPKLFLQKYLLKELKKPFIPPRYFDINSFVYYLNEIEGEDNLEVLFILIKILKEIKSKKAENIFKNINHTLAWANIFLKSFEELDMELKEYEDIKYLSSYEFEGKLTFLEIFPEVYEKFYKKLKEKNLTTRGLAYKNLSKNGNYDKLKHFEKIYFVLPPGITKSEEKILQNLSKLENVIFYLEEIELEFLRNTKIKKFDKKIEEPDVKFYPCSGSLNQILTLKDLLAKLECKGEDIVIVLPEPRQLIALLENVISAFPQYHFNISMGFPFNLTPIFKFIELALKVQISKQDKKYYSQVLIDFLSSREIINFFKSPQHYKIFKNLEKEIVDKNLFYISKKEIFEILKDFKKELDILFDKFIEPFEEIKDLKDLNKKIWDLLKIILKGINYPFYYEYFEKIFEFLKEIKDVEISDLKFSKEELIEIFLNLLKNIKIYFPGSPLKGIQILGFLETRTISFENVFFLNLNEGKVPEIKSIKDPLLTISLRKILSLPGPKEEEEVQSHHFWHLLNSSKNMHCFYINNEEEEPKSRFIEQLIWKIEKKQKKSFNDWQKAYKFDLKIRKNKPLIIKKDAEIKKLLKEMEFSASSLDNYLSCPLKFYFENILKLKEKEALEEDIEALSIGTIVHQAMEYLQKPYLNKKIDEKTIKEMVNNIKYAVENAFEKNNFEIKGLNYLIFLLAEKRIFKYLKNDFFAEPFEIISIEEKLQANLKDFKLKGKIDRIDRINGNYRVLDFKTGAIKKFLRKKGINGELKEYKDFQKNIESFQIPLYIYLAKEKFSIDYEKIYGSIYSFRESKSQDTKIINEDIEILINFLNIIVNSDEDFKPTPKDENICNYCILKNFCNKFSFS